METELDEVEEAKRDWQDVLREFNTMFEKDLALAKTEMKHVNEDAPVSEFKCDKCGKPLLEKVNKYGKYLACSGYPECSNTMGIDEEGKPKAKVEAKETEHVCEKCGSPMVIKMGRRGEFMACSAYPKCKNARDIGEDGKPAAPRKVETEIECDRCHKNKMVIRMGRRGPFLGCGGYPKCRNTRDITADEMKERGIELPANFAIAAAPAAASGEAGAAPGEEQKCPDCGKPMAKKFGRRGAFLACTGYPDCKKTAPLPGTMREAPKPSGEMCDKCGKPMMIRQSKRGPFQGCSGYPACKNAKPLPGGAPAEGPAGKPRRGKKSGDDDEGESAGAEVEEQEAET
jgi:DNA topoisomerase-1